MYPWAAVCLSTFVKNVLNHLKEPGILFNSYRFLTVFPCIISAAGHIKVSAQISNTKSYPVGLDELEFFFLCSARNRCHFFNRSFSVLSRAFSFSSSLIRMLSAFFFGKMITFFRLSGLIKPCLYSPRQRDSTRMDVKSFSDILNSDILQAAQLRDLCTTVGICHLNIISQLDFCLKFFHFQSLSY